MADNVTNLQSEDHRQHLRMLEAILFASAEPLGISELAVRMDLTEYRVRESLKAHFGL